MISPSLRQYFTPPLHMNLLKVKCFFFWTALCRSPLPFPQPQLSPPTQRSLLFPWLDTGARNLSVMYLRSPKEKQPPLTFKIIPSWGPLRCRSRCRGPWTVCRMSSCRPMSTRRILKSRKLDTIRRALLLRLITPTLSAFNNSGEQRTWWFVSGALLSLLCSSIIPPICNSSKTSKLFVFGPQMDILIFQALHWLRLFAIPSSSHFFISTKWVFWRTKCLIVFDWPVRNLTQHLHRFLFSFFFSRGHSE